MSNQEPTEALPAQVREWRTSRPLFLAMTSTIHKTAASAHKPLMDIFNEVQCRPEGTRKATKGPLHCIALTCCLLSRRREPHHSRSWCAMQVTADAPLQAAVEEATQKWFNEWRFQFVISWNCTLGASNADALCMQLMLRKGAAKTYAVADPDAAIASPLRALSPVARPRLTLTLSRNGCSDVGHDGASEVDASRRSASETGQRRPRYSRVRH